VKSGLNIGGPPSKPFKLFIPIVNKYCEGKVKSTLNRGWKRPEIALSMKKY